MKTTWYFLFLIILAALGGHAGESDQPVAKLPATIKPEPGKLSLLADYSAKKGGGIPLYLVNTTPGDILVPSQDGDVYAKLEFKNAKGNWQRAQDHWYGWCGNSYYSLRLRSQHFLKFVGYQPGEGKQAVIRYVIYPNREIASNIGKGVVAAKDIERAANDAMALSSGSFDFVSSVALGKRKLKSGKDRQRNAIRALASKRFDLKKSRKVLEQVRNAFPEHEREVQSAFRRLKRVERLTSHPASLMAEKSDIEKLYGSPIELSEDEHYPFSVYKYSNGRTSWVMQIYYKDGRVGNVTYQKYLNSTGKPITFDDNDIKMIMGNSRHWSDWKEVKSNPSEPRGSIPGLGNSYAERVFVAEFMEANCAFVQIWENGVIQASTTQFLKHFEKEKKERD